MKKFKKYVFENDFCSPPPLDSDESILKSWLEQKMSRKPLVMGAINNETDEDYTPYEIKKIKELFTNDEINSLCPQDWKADLKKNSKIYIPVIIGVLLILKFAINYIGIFYIFLIIFIIVWNIFIKSLVFGVIWQLFGNRHMVRGKSYREIYQITYDSQSVMKSLVWDSLLAPIVFYYLTYFIFF